MVANVRGAAQGHWVLPRAFPGWGFWGELPEPAHGVAVWALGLLCHSGWVALGGAGDGNGQAGLAPAALQLLLCCSSACSSGCASS